ncbi:MAG: transcriptional repressor LexA [Candidatus Shapirobacteria bacterium]
MPFVVYYKQRQILDYLSQYIQKNGYAPTLKEIAQAIGVNSLATVHGHITEMVKRGLVRRFKGSFRGLEVLERGVAGSIKGVDLPILGFIAAGQPIEPITDPNSKISVSPELISGKRRAFVLQVKGVSLIEDGILDGDFVVIEEQTEAKNGDLVVALLENGFATLKRFFKETTRVRLEPANAQMQPIFAKNVRIQGKVVGLVRRYARD